MEDAPTSHRLPPAPWWRRWRTVALVAALLSVAGGIVVLRVHDGGAPPPGSDPTAPASMTPSDPSAVAPDPTVRIAPDGDGPGVGSGWADAAPLSALPGLLASAPPGTEVLLRADAGPYVITGPVVLAGGGNAEAPVVIRGVDVHDRPLAAEILGNRVDPYQPGGNHGPEAFRLTKGADHLVFEDLAFRNIGNGCFRVAADIADLTIRRITATNVRRFIENYAASDSGTATVSGLTVTDVQATGYSRAFARIQYDSHDLLFEDVAGDSQGQDLDPFAQGIQLSGTVHSAVFRRVSMDNAVDTSNEYWNSDGFSAEEETYDLRFEQTSASGNTDAGYDLKSRSATLLGVEASDNKRNYRFFGGITVEGCIGTNPHLRGGSGTQTQVHATRNAVVTMTRCTFVDGDPRTIVFDVDGSAQLTVTDSAVAHSPEGRLSTVEPDGALRTDRVQVS